MRIQMLGDVCTTGRSTYVLTVPVQIYCVTASYCQELDKKCDRKPEELENF
jgi:hypothetical protein